MADKRWRPIETAPKDRMIWVYAAAYQWDLEPSDMDLPAFQCPCHWHPDGGFCVDELRFPTHWVPLEEMDLEPPEDLPVTADRV